MPRTDVGTWNDTGKAIVGLYSGLLGKGLIGLETDSSCKKDEFTILCFSLVINGLTRWN